MRNPFKLAPDMVSEKARRIRQSVIYMNSNAGAGHTGADLSEADILASLYFNILSYTPENLENPERDRFILSKGHGVGGYYCTLAEAGFIPKDYLDTYLKKNSLLPGHPVRQKTPGIEFNTGALGHGLPVATGLALAAKKQNKDYKTYVLLGDGELEEGSNWEASMAASHFKLDNLIVIVDRNGLQLADRTESIMALEPLDKKFEAFGYSVTRINGNDPVQIIEALNNCTVGSGKPHLILAETTKGKGVSFIENQPAWHHKIPVGDEIQKAIEELE